MTQIKKDIDQIATLTRIDLSEEPPKPEVCLSIKSSRVMTMGNFSVIKGKSKSKKTFLTSLMTSSMIMGQAYRLKGNTFGKDILLFDTEQGHYDAWHTAYRPIRITKFTGLNNYFAYELRANEPDERCEIIGEILKQRKPGFVIIDGIADLANGNNDEEEAIRVSSLVMRWTKQYNCHMTCIIHENKANNYAMGHLGTKLMNKAEVVISANKDDENKRRSIVVCDMIRGTFEFDDFEIEINDSGLPFVVGDNLINKKFEF